MHATLGALAVLRDEGYEVVSLSGGEPFLYRQLGALLEGAVELGFAINAVTNATVLTAQRLAPIADHLAFVAVSLDGTRDRHDHLRGRKGAFDDALRGIERLREAQVPFGLTCCVTAVNLVDVPELYDLAVETGARLLNLRPLALVGRGTELGDELALGPSDAARLVLLADLLGADPDGVGVRVDLAPTGGLRAQAYEAHPLLRGEPGELSLSDLVNPLILDDRGRLLPFAYGLHPRFALTQGLGDLQRELATWRANGAARLRELLERGVRGLPDDDDAPVDWFAHLTEMSQRPRAAEASAQR